MFYTILNLNYVVLAAGIERIGLDQMSSKLGIVVLGPYRSGTSVTAQVLKALGVDFGPKRHMIPASRQNPGGFFERKDINDANNALIHSAGATLADPGDPRLLSTRGNPQTLTCADLSWLTSTRCWGIKDPRMCATLLAWIEFGVLNADALRIVHVRRNLDAAVRSGMAFDSIRAFCDGTEPGVRAMLDRYAVLAQWHVDSLRLPVHTLDYEYLVKDPSAVDGLAEFLGVADPRQIRRAVSLVGKGKGVFALQMERLFIRAPRRLFNLLARRNSDDSLNAGT